MAKIAAYMLMAPWLALYAGLTLVRAALAWRYVRQNREASTALPYTILQPILSGDPDLAGVLARNAAANPGARVIWLIDDDDKVAQSIAGNLAFHNVVALSGPPPSDGENPKLVKLQRGLALVETPVVLVVDDDTSIDAAAVSRLVGPGDALTTGLPIFQSKRTFYERLVEGFVNGNAILTYFSCSAVGVQRTINGMFYALPTGALRDLGGFAGADGELTDDYAMARLFQENGRPVIQKAAFCAVGMSIDSADSYAHVMRRWMIFANQYFRRNASPLTLLLAAIPGALPLLGLYMAPLPVLLTALLGKAVVNRTLLFRISKYQSTPLDVLFEVASDLLLPAWWIGACIRPNRVRWRSRDIDLSTGVIRYR